MNTVKADFTSATSTVAERLDKTLAEIGVARFVGRINAGVIESTEGYEAVERLVSREKARPLLSRLSHAILGKTDTFDSKV